MKPQENISAKLTEGDVGVLLRKRTIEMLFGVAGMVIFNLTDTIYIGRLGTKELAALSFTFPVAMVVMSIGAGMGVGASSIISRALGESNHQKVQRLTTDSLVLSVLLAALFVTAGMFTIEPLFLQLGADSDIMHLIREYMEIWYIGVIFLMIPIVGNNAFRAQGDMKTAAAIMMLTIAVNIILDPLLIFGLGPFPKMGLKGNAIGTVIAGGIGSLVCLYFLHFRDKMLTLIIPKLKEELASWKALSFIALPAAASRMIAPVSIGIITRIISDFGKDTVAAFGTAIRLEFIILSVIVALSFIMNPFIGQNVGAGRIDRVKEGLHKSKRFAIYWGFGAWIVSLAFGWLIARAFSHDTEVIFYITLFLGITPIGYCMKGTFEIIVNSLNVLERPLHATILNIMQMFALYVPLVYLGAYFFEVAGIFGALAISNLLAGSIGHFVLKDVIRKVEKKGTAIKQQSKMHEF